MVGSSDDSLRYSDDGNDTLGREKNGEVSSLSVDESTPADDKSRMEGASLSTADQDKQDGKRLVSVI